MKTRLEILEEAAEEYNWIMPLEMIEHRKHNKAYWQQVDTFMDEKFYSKDEVVKILQDMLEKVKV